MKRSIITLVFAFVSSIVLAQTTTENYVKSTTYKKAVKTQSEIDALIDDDKIESVTYLDGLGRPKQSIVKQAGGHKQHIVVPVFYDGYGRQVEDYLPMQSLVTGSTALDYIDNVTLIASQKTHYNSKYPGEWANVSDVNAFSKKHFENSPLNRVLEQGAPGEDWKVDEASDTDHTIKFDYQLNAVSDHVILFDVTFINSNTEDPELGYDGYYSANELYKTITRDENWQPGQTYDEEHTVEEFTNAKGQLVLKRTYNKRTDNNIVSLEILDTYYVYDDFDNLTYVLSPEGSETILDINNNIDQTVLEKFGYQYRYDHRNRLVEKKIPQKGWEYIVYDKLDRPVLAQDANMRANDEWLFTKYDAFDRVAYTGIFVSTGTRAVVQNAVDTQIGSLNETRESVSLSIPNYGNTKVYYSSDVYPESFESVLTVNYYDDYSWDTENAYQASYDLDLSSGMSLTNNLVEKTLNFTAWNTGFTTDNTIVDDGYIQWTIKEADKNVTIGLTKTTASLTYHRNEIEYGICTTGIGNNYRVYVYENGVNIQIPATYYVEDDVFRVLRSGDQIYYYKNDVIFHASSVSTTSELMGYGSFLQQDAAAEDVFIGYSSMNQPFAQDVTGLATGSKVRTLGEDKWTTSEMYYDVKGRSIQSTAINAYLDATDRTSSKLDFTGKTIKTHTTHQTGSQTPVVTIDQFTYDHADRLSRQEQRVNNEETELITRNHYDEFGQLEMKQVGGELNIDLNYANTAGVSIVNNVITKTASGSNWGVAGLSTQNGIAEDGYLSFTTMDSNKGFMAGLSYTDPNLGFSSIKYAIYITYGGDVNIYESGVPKGIKTTHVPGDTFTVERRGSTIYYYKNGEHFYTSETAATTATMYGDVAIASSNTRIKDLSIYNLNGALQEVDYTYNVRGWLKDINNVDNLYATGNDLFALKLNYNKKDNTNSTSLYNGNISEIFWNTRTYDASTSESQIKRGYSYEYDALNRLLEANFDKTSGVNQNVLFDLSGVTYDKNGNIQTLARTGVDDLGIYQSDMDNLTYNYDGNQLTNVVEAGDNTIGFKQLAIQNNDYTYDANGNMITDKNKDITSIEYNHLNLPTIVKFGTANTKKITYIYDATGLKLKKIVTDNTNTTTTQYRGNYIYENDGLKFFSHPEGYVEPVGKSFGYVYQYKDHLGNIRLSYSDTSGDGSINPNLEIIEENNYYPFGLKHKGYNSVISANSNSVASKFKYNGKELQDELGLDWYDYGARMYDPSLARFMTVDMATEIMKQYSPYVYSFNSPLMFQDKDGNFPTLAITDPDPPTGLTSGKKIDMTGAPKGSPKTAQGFPRNGRWFWKQMAKKYPEMFSAKNKALIKANQAPMVDPKWVEFNPSHSGYMKDKLVHHHQGQGRFAVGIPKKAHQKFFSKLHHRTGGNSRNFYRSTMRWLNRVSGILVIADFFSKSPESLGSLFKQSSGGLVEGDIYKNLDGGYFSMSDRKLKKDEDGNVIYATATITLYRDYRFNKETKKYEGVGEYDKATMEQYRGDRARVKYEKIINGVY
ncbi:DUF6443 domain-containing protein [uncultured Psychroserpens sp.]|uniref:DUF6443 domain-containing protein n=1 Tax=uncultured Psychroserpens sp. TaxID=255436 RepID=UPI002618C356|nr:DUF6443 domain-containing protein [uncultured Psychroserpens sp.]